MSATPLDSKQNDMLYNNQELPNALTSLFYLQLLLRSESAPKVRETTTAPPEVEGEFDKQESTVRQRQQTAGEAAEAAARAEMEARGETRADTPSARQFTSPLLRMSTVRRSAHDRRDTCVTSRTPRRHQRRTPCV